MFIITYDIELSCATCDFDDDGVGDDWSFIWFGNADTDLTVEGFPQGVEVCARVKASSTNTGGVSEWSDSVCAAAGEEVVAGCTDETADNYNPDANQDDGSCQYCSPGDVNGDSAVNVPDIVILVNYILSGGASSSEYECGDMNGDGVINVPDIVQIVNYILGGGTASLHNITNTADIMITDTNMSVRSEGCVQGVQLELTHNSELSINLDDYFVSEYVTSNNTTRIILVAEDCVNSIGNIEGDYDVVDVILSNHVNEKIDDRVLTVSPFKVKVSGPNPFNPSTSLNVVVPSDSYVSVKIYNIVGQEVATLQDGFMAENFNGYTLNWNASNLASGVYLVRAEAAGQVSFEKFMLLK